MDGLVSQKNKNMKKVIITSIAIFTATTLAFSQLTLNQYNGYYIDGLRLSQNTYGGTARSAALGGAFAALGGDMGSLSINPAGIGVYSSSEFSITPGFENINTTSNYLGNKKNDVDYKSNLSNIGVVFTYKSNNSSGWLSSSFAFGYNRLNSYNSSYFIEGRTNSTSMVNEFLYYGQNTSPENLNENWERLAYDAYVINPDTTVTAPNYRYTSPYTNINLLQRHQLVISGSSGEYYFGFGTNFDNQLYLGASLNITSAYYTEDIIHSEYDVDAVTDLNYYQFSHYITTIATGANFKLGAIYRPNDMFRFGLSFHTPTITKVSQEFDSQIQSSLKSTGYYDYSGPVSSDEYNVSTPFRAIAGAAIIFKQLGLVSLDYEFIDYRSIHFSNGYYESDLQAANQDNKNMFRATNNLRAGIELKFGSAYLRGGYAFYASPFASGELNKDANTQIFSGGVGYRNNNFFLDFSYSLTTKAEKYLMYYDPTASSVNLSTNSGNCLATIGFRF
jgi:hypothetical protein